MATETRQRTNEDWLSALTSADDRRRAAAHGDLSNFIRRGLAASLAARGGVDDATLEDFSQEAALRVLEKLDTFRGQSRFTTWVLSIALRIAYTELRRRRWRDVSLERFEGVTLTEPPAWTGPAPSPRIAAQRNQIVDVLYRTINNDLTQRQKTLLLAELQGVATVVIEERLGINRNALYKLGHDARKRLRAALSAEGLTAQEVEEAFS